MQKLSGLYLMLLMLRKENKFMSNKSHTQAFWLVPNVNNA